MARPGHTHDRDGHVRGPGAARAANRRRLAIALALVGVYTVAEVVGGIAANSLALLADAGHMLSDTGALALSLFAMWIAERPPTPRRSYGYYRTEVLAALVNGVTLVVIAVLVLIEAGARFGDPPEVRGGLVMAIAGGGLLINLAGLLILHAGREASLNVRGAWLHVLTDALGSVGAIAGGLLVWAFGWAWADPVASVLIGLLVVYSAWRLVRETVSVLMESAPAGLDVEAVREEILAVAGVSAVHDLHVWSITSGMASLSAHVRVEGGRPPGVVLGELRRRLEERFGIDHSTIQIEHEGMDEETAHA
ncbi:MAG: cation diffusion facilitator family transporter [Gemmatimonadaceae bacterium]